MRASIALAAIIVSCLVLAGCGEDAPPPDTAWEKAEAEKTKAQIDTELREYMEEHKGKAGEAAQEQQDREEADRKAIEEAGG
jgi:outer membrane biogenesis lipoprotein LolB